MNIKKPHRRKYNKEKTKQKLISAVGKILVKEGYAGIGINKIESVSGVTKKLIYDYFKGLNGLVKAYLRQVDFWKIEENKMDNKQRLPKISQEFMYNLLKDNFEYLLKSSEMQKIILWGISQKNKAIKELIDEREKFGEIILESADKDFKNSQVDYRATIAVFVSAIYYITLHINANESTMCGIDVSTKEGKDRILSALQRLINQTYTFADTKF